MRDFLRSAWQSLTKSRYTRYLEAEVELLRAELRLWQDAALVQNGLPRLTPHEAKPFPKMSGKLLPSQWKAKLERQSQPLPEKPQ